jgi:hypothetical protein
MRPHRSFAALALFSLAACGGTVASTPATGGPADTGVTSAPDAGGVMPDAVVGAPDADSGSPLSDGFVPPAAQVALAYDGSSSIASGASTFGISAPILPHTFTAGSAGGIYLYAYEGANFPTTLAGEQTVAFGAAVTYESLLVQCAATRPAIVLQSSGGPALPQSTLASNLEQVAQCAYADLGIKPYWIPQLIDDVDICGHFYPGWSLPTEADLAALSDADRTAWQQAANEQLFGSFDVYVRAADGTLAHASLASGNRSVLPFASIGAPYDPKVHYEGGVNLRCIRRASS